VSPLLCVRQELPDRSEARGRPQAPALRRETDRHVPGPKGAGILYNVTGGELNPGVLRTALPLPQSELIVS
jgi:hypothetical protein